MEGGFSGVGARASDGRSVESTDRGGCQAAIQREKRGKIALQAIREEHCGVLERLLTEIRRRHYSIRTEQVYELWVCRFIAFHKNEAPTTLGKEAVIAFLEYLAVQRNVAASIQNQALNAWVFLYKQVLDQPLEDLGDFARAKRPKRLPSFSRSPRPRR